MARKVMVVVVMEVVMGGDVKVMVVVMMVMGVGEMGDAGVDGGGCEHPVSTIH